MTKPTQAEIEAALKPKRYTKNPLTIEAFQITEELALAHLIDGLPLPFGLRRAGATYHPIRRTVSNFSLSIETLEGKMRAEIGDYIIKGIEGELYPCKPDIFEASYHISQPEQQEAVGDMTQSYNIEKEPEKFGFVKGWNARGAALTTAKPAGWRTIDSAPRDGQAIMVYIKSPHSGDGWNDVVYYNDNRGMFMAGMMCVGHDFITHWQPLPAPPAEDGEA